MPSLCVSVQVTRAYYYYQRPNLVLEQATGSFPHFKSNRSTSLALPRSGSSMKRCAPVRRVANKPRAEAAAAVTIEKGGVKIVRNPPESKLAELGVRNWPKWGCAPSKFPWTYSAKETCYILEGKVKVYPDGSDEVVEIGAGDLVVFPKGMSCTWDVSEGVDKHYNFE